MELSRKEEFRNKKISLGVTLFSFVTMVSFFVFKTFVYTNDNNEPRIDANFSVVELGVDNSGYNNSGAGKKALTAVSSEKKMTTDEKILSTTTGEVVPVKNTTREIANAFKNNSFKVTETESTGQSVSKDHNDNTPGNEANGSASVDFNLLERFIVSSPEFESDTREQGKVVVEILVDKNGNVLEAEPSGRGTTTSSFLLKNEAKKIALATKFNENRKFEEQKGTITITFSFD